jgi:FkbM family methyltransferase
VRATRALGGLRRRLRQPPAEAPACRFDPAVLAPPPPARLPLCGTYVGNGRVLVFLETGGRLYLSADDLSLVGELVQHGMYDRPFTRFLHRELQSTDTFVDVGANVGLFTIIGGYIAWQGRTIAYEAAPPLHRLLADNVAANWFTERVSIRPVAVGREQTRASFGFSRQLQGLGALGLDTASLAETLPGVDVETFDVDVVPLDDDLNDHNDIALVKIDVEGGEAGVLAGMHRLFERGVVRALSLEVRCDVTSRNQGEASWDELVTELRWLGGLGARFSVPDDDGIDHPVDLAEVERTALYSNLVVRLPR